MKYSPGSELTAFPCSSCTNCGAHTDSPFNEGKSNTHTKISCEHTACTAIKSHKCESNQCTLNKHYYEGSSWNARASEDLLWTTDPNTLGTLDKVAADKHAIPFVFGCQNDATGLFRTQVANGIMGFADTPNNLVRQLVKHSHMQHNLFSMCYTGLWPRQHKDVAGVLVLGDTDTRLHKTPMQYAKRALDHHMMKTHRGIYMVEVVDIKVGGVSIGALPKAAQAAIVDSGTQDSYCPLSISSQFARAFRKALKPDVQQIVPDFNAAGVIFLTKQQRELLPEVEFVLKGADNQTTTLRMPSDHYMEPGTATQKGCHSDTCAFKFTLQNSDPASSPCTFGANLMQGV